MQKLRTWTPEPGMNDKQIQKELKRQLIEGLYQSDPETLIIRSREHI